MKQSWQEIERLCRLNGKCPNARDRWKAIYRLWRLATRDSDYVHQGRDDSFRTLFPMSYPVMNADADFHNRSHWPAFLRRRMIESERRRRLAREQEAKMVFAERLLAAIMQPVEAE